MGMNTTRACAALIALTFLAAEGLSAQRRGTSGSGSGGRSTPSGNRGGSTPSSSRGGSSGGERGSGGSSPSASSRGSRDGQTAAAPANSTQSRGRTDGSKIGAVRREADRAAARVGGGGVYVDRGIYVGGGCYYYYCDPYWGWYGRHYGWYHRGYWYPARRRVHYDDDDNNERSYGQGYDEYPYAADESDDGNDQGSGFVRSGGTSRRGFGAVTAQYFSDAGSTAQAGRFGIEGARGIFRGELEFASYAERTTTTIDRMHSFRVAVGVQPRLGNNAYLTATVGARGIALNQGGQSSGGPEVSLGVQLLPKKPLGVNITGRAAAMSWNGVDYYALRELNTTGSIFINRLELQGGWHWLKLGSSPAFGGPVAGLRIWF